MIPVQDKTHAAEGAALLIELFKQAPVVSGMVAVLMAEMQTMENALFSLLNAIPLTAHPLGGGNWDLLDKIGSLVGEPRNGLSDADYLPRIKIRIRVNISNGLAEDIIQIGALVSPNAATYFEYPTAAWELRLPYSTNGTVLALEAYLHQAKAAGTSGRLNIEETLAPWLLGDSVSGTGSTGLRDAISGNFPYSLASAEPV